ncbi:hypothetical protein HXX76_003389 [Chlamydomonas incerta]|uniref:Uncharacterized protein n=1 Tax=Chlamydomonas incerta TaxID=51695 RepID=A0A835W9N1_CHLIN|nr:hypothetical protein HXX76_003389 [Chlamydomonas incerta]|eukprot:KAG2441776.1 hypothetical protein HXX76_003389 [Chlamydomonas incerta]
MGSGCSTAVSTACKSAPIEPNPDGQLKPAQNIIQRLRDKKRLRVAIGNNDVSKVKELVHRMPLEQINYVPMEKKLFDCSKNPGRRGDCALLVAAKLRHAGIVSTLLLYGALPDLTNETGESALVVACDNNDVAIATDLLTHKANPNIPSPKGSFPLHIAASNLCPPIAKALVDHGADVNLRESGTMDTPLHIAVLAPDAATEANRRVAVEIATIIIDSERVDFTVRDGRQDTALLKATKKSNTVLLAAFVDAGAPTNLFDASGQAALHLAIAMGSKPGAAMALRLARAEQTDVNLLSKLGLSPLLMAVRGVLGEVVEALLARGADPNIMSDPGKEAPLHTALLQVPKELSARLQQRQQPAGQAGAPTPSEAIAMAILSSGRADVNLQDGAARRPVFLAVTCCSTLVLAKLIEAKADLAVRDGDGHTPTLKAVLLAVQVEGEKDKAVDGVAAAERRAGMVIKAAPNISATGGPQQHSALHCVVSVGVGSAALFEQLMAQQADINVLNKAGNSPLHAAICSIGGAVGHAQDAAIKMVKSGRAQIDLRNSSQDTALTLAAARHAAAVMAELVGAGADVNAANSSGDTAAHLACRSIGGDKARKWGPDAAQVLLRSSALKLDVVNGEGQTALAVLAASARWFEGAVGVAGAMVAQSTCTLNNLDKRGLSALHYCLGAGPACGGLSGLGHGPALALVLIPSPKCDVDLTSRDKAAEAAIHRVSELGLPEVCAALLARSANPNAANGGGMRPLHLAINGSSEGHNAVAEQLISSDDCDVNIVMPSTGQTPLLMAVVKCKAGLAERLVKRGADPNVADKQGDAPLHAALRTTGKDSSNERTALLIINCGRADLDAKSPAGDAPLHAAVANCATASLRALVGHGAKLDVADGGGCTSLHRAGYAACKARDARAEERAVILVTGGANCDIADPQGCTAMHISVECGVGSHTLFKALMDAKAGLDLRNGAKRTPLHIVTLRLGDLADAEAMGLAIIGSGRANLDLQTGDGNTALMITAGHPHLVLVKALLGANANPNLRNSSQETALTLAAARHAAAVMGELVGAGADVNAANSSGDTAAHLACRSIGGDKARKWGPDAAQVLLRSSALKLDLANGEGQTALAVLAASARWFEGAVGVAGAMVAQSTCTLNNLDKRGLSALHYCLGAGPACGGLSGLGHGPALALVLIPSPKCDVDLTSRDKAAEAAIHRVSELGLPEVCAALLARSANPNAANGGGMRPLHLAIQGGSGDAKRTRVAEQLLDCAKTDVDLVTPAGQTPLLMVVLQLREPLVARIIKRGADPNIADKQGDTPLHAALRLLGDAADSAKDVSLRVSLALVAYGRTDVDAKSAKDGSVPIHISVSLASLPLVQALVARRANLNAVDSAGSSPLHRAILLDGKARGQAYEPIAVALVEGGADPSQVDRAGASTPLHLVAGTGNAAIYRALAGRGAGTNAYDKAGRTALHLAIKSAKKSGRSEFDTIACGIVETPATDVNLATRPANKTPLLLAVRGLRPAVLTALIGRRADANTASKKGQTPLISALEMTEAGGAAAGVSHAMAKALIDSGLPNVDTVRASDRSSPAHFAVRLAAADLLAALIARRADLGLQDAGGCTVLHLATKMACPDGAAGLKLMQQLLSAKAPASLQDTGRCTPLHLAVYHRGGSLAAVQALVGQRQVGIAADALDAQGRTALASSILTCGKDEQSAATKGNNMALAIIGSGHANLNVPDPDGDTPVLLAVRSCKDASVLSALLAGGANAATRNKAQQAPLLLAVELRGSAKLLVRQSACGDMALALAGCSSVEVNAQHAASGDTALHLAVAQQFSPLVNLLLQKRADVNVKNNASCTVAHNAIAVAAAGGDEACSLAFAVIRGGADVNIKKPDGWTCLHLAVGLTGPGRLLPLFEAVMARSPQLDAVTAKGSSALHLATQQAASAPGDANGAHVTMCKALLSAGANANIAAAGFGGRTPLHLAVAMGAPAVFNALLAHGATNLDVVDGGGSTPLHLALDRAGSEGSAQARDMALALIRSRRASLQLADAQRQAPLAKAISHGLQEVVSALLAAGAPCNAVDPLSGVPPLLQATYGAVRALSGRDAGAGALCNRAATLEALIAHSGVEVDATDKDGDTALHNLVAAGATALAAKLMERRPNLNLQNAAQDTPLHLAMKNAGSDAAKCRLVLGMLRQGGARLTLQDKAGNTAMHLAFDLASNQEVFDACAAQCTDLNILNAKGMAPLHLAVCSGPNAERQLGVLLRSPGKCDVDLRSGGKDTPLLMALRQRGSSAEPLVRLLLGKSASVNAPDGNGYTALTLSLREKVADSLILLLIGARGANLDAQEPQRGDSAAAMALRDGRAELVAALLRGGAKTGLKNKEGEALIHLALAGNLGDATRTRYVKMLVDHNADLNAADGAGRVPLMLLLRPTTAVDAQVELAMFMLDGGARPVNDLDPTSGLGWIHAGCYNVKFITKWKTCRGSLDTVADANTIIAFRSRLLAAWSSAPGRVADALFQQTNSRVTAITLAALGGWTAAVSAFLDFGVSPNVGATCGAKAVTPFMVALLQGNTAMAKLLKDKGAKVDGEDNGINPMCMAIQVSKGLLGGGCSSYDVSSVPQVVANKLVNFTKAVAKDLLMEAVHEHVGDAATDAAAEVAQEVLGEAAQEVLLGALDVILPGLTLVRWGFKLAKAMMGAAHDESLRLAGQGCMTMVQWLLGVGCDITLTDPGMAEMVEMIVSDESGAGWAWAGLQLSWPASFQPMLNQGLAKIQKSFEQRAREAEAEGRGTYGLADACEEAKAKFAKAVKVSITLQAIKKKGNGRR